MRRSFIIIATVSLFAAVIAAATIGKEAEKGFFLVARAQSAPTSTAQSTSSLQVEIDVNNQQIASLNQQIATYQQELQQVGANKKTLQAAINALNLQKSKVQAQVAATEKQIDVTQLQIQELGSDIQDTQQSISAEQEALGAELLTLQKSDGQPLFMQLLGSMTISQAWTNVNATLQMQEAIQTKMQSLQGQKSTLADSQTASEQEQTTLSSQQQSLTAQQQSLTATEQSKDQLLAETNSQEATYEKLLAAAESQLQSFSAFTQNAGGSKLLGNQTQCDSWGCYYSQRDTAWGNDSLDGTKYTLASDGCLVTAMAMVMTHYGYKDVTPVTINSNPNDFAAYYPAYLLTTINVDGVTATRKAVAIDATLATGNPVIVGLDAYGGTHFVVLVSGSKGNYIMKDPYVANGNDIPFTDHYSLKSIYAIAKVVISS
jgi:peptidoglycan hydrolase CwlO-like protein